MSVSKMYPVHVMRKFVCERLTAAAQEILGAFERRVEDYEAELARQRRLLDKVFSHETKLQQTEIPISEEQYQLNQHSNNEAGSRFVPDITKIKDEHEESCISEERLQHPQQHQTTGDPNVSSNHPLPLAAEQQSSVHFSNKYGYPDSDREMSAVSAAHGDQENSCEVENQLNAADDNEGVIGHIEASVNEKSGVLRPEETSTENTLFAGCSDEMPDQINDENAASQVNTEHFSDENCDDANPTPASLTEPTQLEESNTENTKLDSNDEPAQIKTTASTTNDEQNQNTMHRSDNKTSLGATESALEGNENQDEKSALTRSAEPTQSEESQGGSPVSSSSATPDKTSQDGKHGLTQSLEATQTEKSSDKDIIICGEQTYTENTWNGEPTSTERAEQIPHETSDDKNMSSAASTSKILSKVIATSSNKTKLKHKKKPKDEKRSNKNSDPETKAKDQKICCGKLRSRKKCSDDSKRFNVDSASTSGDDPNDATWELSNESSGVTPVDEGATPSFSSSKPAQDKKIRDGSASSARSNESDKEETTASTETPVRRLRDRTKASSSKSQHKSSNGSKTSSKESSSKRTASSRSKEGTSLKRHNEGQSIDSAQKKGPKDESSTSTKSREEKKPEKCSKEGTASNKNPEPSRCQSDDTSGNSAEERESPYKCDMCGKVMSNFKNYKFHMKSHTVEKTLKCNTCGKMFRESWDLNKHLVIHCVEKPFKCDICGNGFNRRYNLDLHARVHTGEKPYKCNTCGKSFSSGVNRKKHTRIHTGEKPYTCKDCTKEFADSSAFKNHLRVHTGEKPFKCTYCMRKFATRTTLKRHTRTHTGEKPYKCTVCDKNFGHKTDLNGHIRMHTGEKPYKCTRCEDQFSSWSKLNKHKRVHASEAKSSADKPGLDKKEHKAESA